MVMWCLVLSSAAVFSGTFGMVISGDAVQDNHLLPTASNQRVGSCRDTASVLSCFKMKSLVLLDGLVVKDTPIPLFGSALTLVKSAEGKSRVRSLPITMEELNSSLPEDEQSREGTLDKLISLSFSKFVRSRALQVRLPDLSSWELWTGAEEARKKKGGGNAGWVLMSVGGMMGALGLGAIALLAGKALLVSMMALMLSALAAMRKGGGGHADHAATTYEVINVPTGHGHHGRGRSEGAGLDLPGDMELVYRAHPTGSSSQDSGLQGKTR